MLGQNLAAAASGWVTTATGSDGVIAGAVTTIKDNLDAIVPAALPVVIAVAVAVIGWRLVKRFLRG